MLWGLILRRKDGGDTLSVSSSRIYPYLCTTYVNSASSCTSVHKITFCERVVIEK
jgi:hypothetical protein